MFFTFTSFFFFFFFFNDTATTEIYTLSLHDALPIRMRSLAPATRSVEAALEDGRARAAALAAPSPIESRRNLRRLAGLVIDPPCYPSPRWGGGIFEANAIPVLGKASHQRALVGNT